jgi:hypothetical protein
MTKVNRAFPPEPSQELIGKLIRAGYLQPVLRHDAVAITKAIAQLREDLRGGEKVPKLRNHSSRHTTTSAADKSGLTT